MKRTRDKKDLEKKVEKMTAYEQILGAAASSDQHADQKWYRKTALNLDEQNHRNAVNP